MEFIVSQICGIIAAISVMVSSQLKNIKPILAWQIISNGVGALSYILLGGLSGCGIYILAVAQSVVYYLFRVREKEAPDYLAAVFALFYLACSVATYKGAVDIIAGAAALLCAFGLAQKKASVYRVILLANGTLWIFYDLSVGAYTMILTHAIIVVSSLVGIIRLDLKR